MKNVLIAAFLCCTLISFSQSVNWTNEILASGKIIDILGEKSGTTYTINNDGKGFLLVATQSDLTVSYAKKLKFPKLDGKQQRFLRAFMVKGNITVLGLLNDMDTRKMTIVSYQLDEEGNILPEYNRLCDINIEIRDVLSEYKMEFSADSSFVLFNHNTPLNKGRNVRSTYILCDSKFNVLVNGYKMFEKSDRDIFIMNVAVSNQGNFVLQSDVQKLAGSNVSSQLLALSSYNKNGEMVAEKEMLIPNAYVQSEGLCFIGNNMMYSAYWKDISAVKSNSALPEDDRLNGLYVASYTPSLVLKFQSNSSLKNHHYGLFMTPKELEKAKAKGTLGVITEGKGELLLRDVIVTKSGMTLISEFENNLGMSRLLGDIVISHLDEKGKMLWMNRIPKNQDQVNKIMGDGMIDYHFDIYSQMEKQQKTSFILGSDDQKISLLMYANPGDELLSNSAAATTFNSKKALPMKMLISYDGKIKKSISNLGDDFTSSLTLNKRIGSSSFRIAGKTKKGIKLGSLSLD